MHQGKRRRWALLAAVGAIGAALLGANSDDQQLQCEAAMAHLASCCPGFDPTMRFCQVTTGCGVTTYPDLDVADSQCIEGLDCAAIVARNLCGIVAALPSTTVSTDDDCSSDESTCRPTQTQTGHGEVCASQGGSP